MPVGYFPSRSRLGDYLGAGIEGFAQNFRAARDQKRQQAMQDEDRSRAMAREDYEAGQHGFHYLGPNQFIPSSVLDPAIDFTRSDVSKTLPWHAQTAGAIDTTAPYAGLTDSQRDQFEQPKVPAYTSATAERPTPSNREANPFHDFIANALAPAQAPAGPRLQIGNGYYVDNQEAERNQARTAALTGQSQFRQALIPALAKEMAGSEDRRRTAGEYEAAGLTPQQAAAASENPTVAAALLHPQQTEPLEPVMVGGKRIYQTRANAVGKEAPAPAAAVVSPTEKFQSEQGNKILDDYARDTKDFHQVMSGWSVLQGAMKNPSLATPFAVTDAYARITNPGAIVRPTTMEMINQMGSVGQRMRKYWEHNANGALPPDIMNDIAQTLFGIVNEHKTQYDQIRSKAILRGQREGVDVGPLLEDYKLENPAQSTQGGGRGAAPTGNINLGGVTPDERAHLKSLGYTDAQINLKYGPPR